MVRKYHPQPVKVRMYDRRYDPTRPIAWDRRKEKEFRQALTDGDLDLQSTEIDAHRSCSAQFERDRSTLQLIKDQNLYCLQQFETTVTFELSVAPPGQSQELFTAKGLLLERIDGAVSLTRPFTGSDSYKIIKDAYISFDQLVSLGILLKDYNMDNVIVVNNYGLEVKFLEISNCLLKSDAASHNLWKADVVHFRIHFRDAINFAIEETQRKQSPPNICAEHIMAWTDSTDSVESRYFVGAVARVRRRSWQKLRGTLVLARRKLSLH